MIGYIYGWLHVWLATCVVGYKARAQSSAQKDTTNINEFSGGVGKGLAQNSTHYSVPTVHNTPPTRLSNTQHSYKTLLQKGC